MIDCWLPLAKDKRPAAKFDFNYSLAIITRLDFTHAGNLSRQVRIGYAFD